jgi:hypothetical protein
VTDIPEPPSALLERAAATLERLAADTTSGSRQARELHDEPGQANVLVESAQSFGGFSSLFSSSCCGGHCFGHVEHGGDATWIATMSPAGASPLAQWLREMAGLYRDERTIGSVRPEALDAAWLRHPAVVFAKTVLGES